MCEPIIFLDIDGVLVTPRTEADIIGDYARFDFECVAALNQLTNLTGAKLILSSSWRVGEDIGKLRTYFTSQRVTGDLVDMTPIDPLSDREKEISDWLETRPKRPRFVILDDDPYFKELASFHILTNSQSGLTDEDVESSLRILQYPG